MQKSRKKGKQIQRGDLSGDVGKVSVHEFTSYDDEILARVLQQSFDEAKEMRQNIMETENQLQQAMAASRSEAQTCLADISFHYNRINRLLLPNKLSLHRIYPDGDCLFAAVIFLINRANTTISVESFRKIVVQHMLENKDEYSPFMNINETEISYEDAINKIQQPGSWDNSLSDAVPLAICNILSEPMVIYTSQFGNNVLTISPTLHYQTRIPNSPPALHLAHLAV